MSQYRTLLAGADHPHSLSRSIHEQTQQFIQSPRAENPLSASPLPEASQICSPSTFEHRESAECISLRPHRRDSRPRKSLDNITAFKPLDSEHTLARDPMAINLMPQRHMYATLGQDFASSEGKFFELQPVPSNAPRGMYYGTPTTSLSTCDYSSYTPQTMLYMSNYGHDSTSLYDSVHQPAPSLLVNSQTPSPLSLMPTQEHTRSQSYTEPRYGLASPAGLTRSSSLQHASSSKLATTFNVSRIEPNTSAPGPIPATTPMLVRQDQDGVQWIAFHYSRDRIKLEYTIRCDVESVDVEALKEDFKAANCVYPRACAPFRGEYKGNRLRYETECNAVGWALAWLNPDLREKRGLIQRAVDSWRNSNSDEKLRSRRVRRMNKVNSRRAKLSSGSLDASLWRMSCSGAPSPAASLTRSPSLGTVSDHLGHQQFHSDTSIDYMSGHGMNNHNDNIYHGA